MVLSIGIHAACFTSPKPIVDVRSRTPISLRMSSDDDFAEEAAKVQEIIVAQQAKMPVVPVSASVQPIGRTADVDMYLDELNLNSADVEYIVAEADAVFSRIDLNSDGAVSPEELRTHLASTCDLSSADRIFEMLDANNDGSVSRDELREAYCRYENATLRRALGLGVISPPQPMDAPSAPSARRWSLADEVFDGIDANHDGAISNREMRSYLAGTGYSLTTIDSIFSALDINNDNEISRQELRNAFGRYELAALQLALGIKVPTSGTKAASGSIR